MPKALITTVPFGEKNRLPLELLEKAGIEYLVNPLNKKLTEDELVDLVTDFDVIIAGTEPITKKVVDRASRLKMNSRVGIGLDSVDLLYAKKKDQSFLHARNSSACSSLFNTRFNANTFAFCSCFKCTIA